MNYSVIDLSKQIAVKKNGVKVEWITSASKINGCLSKAENR